MSSRLSVAALAAIVMTVGCGGGGSSRQVGGVAGGQIDCDALFNQAVGRLEAGKRQDARRLLRRFEQRCPRAPQIASAKLFICQTFLEENAADLKAEGVSTCRQVTTFYPQDPAACQAQLKIADYYHGQMRSCERDQTEARQAIDEYQKLIATYPGCAMVDDARAGLASARDRIACADLMVAIFYGKTGRLNAAEHRLTDLLKNYTSFDRRCEAFFRHIELLDELIEIDRARTQFERMSEECGGADNWLEKAREHVEFAPAISDDEATSP